MYGILKNSIYYQMKLLLLYMLYFNLKIWPWVMMILSSLGGRGCIYMVIFACKYCMHVLLFLFTCLPYKLVGVVLREPTLLKRGWALFQSVNLFLEDCGMYTT